MHILHLTLVCFLDSDLLMTFILWTVSVQENPSNRVKWKVLLPLKGHLTVCSELR